MNAASGVSSPCVNICAFFTVTQLVICLHYVFIHEACSLGKTQPRGLLVPTFPACHVSQRGSRWQRGCPSSASGHEAPPGCRRPSSGPLCQHQTWRGHPDVHIKGEQIPFIHTLIIKLSSLPLIQQTCNMPANYSNG